MALFSGLKGISDSKNIKKKVGKKKSSKALKIAVAVLEGLSDKGKTEKKASKSGPVKLVESVVGIVGKRSKKRDADRAKKLIEARATDRAFRKRKSKPGARQGFAL